MEGFCSDFLHTKFQTTQTLQRTYVRKHFVLSFQACKQIIGCRQNDAILRAPTTCQHECIGMWANIHKSAHYLSFCVRSHKRFMLSLCAHSRLVSFSCPQKISGRNFPSRSSTELSLSFLLVVFKRNLGNLNNANQPLHKVLLIT